MNKTCKALLTRMVVNVMAGEHERMYELYDEFVKENRLHVTVEEILRAKREGIA